MTIGEKISFLRARQGLSQEQLAEKLSVSRQAVSGWEIDSTTPSLDKIIRLCELFSITTDELLKADAEPMVKSRKKNKYFGTDGFRGEAGISLTASHAFKVGRFLGWYFTQGAGNPTKLANYKAKIVIGKDTRRSSYMLEYALASGIAASGADAYILHVTTTPSVSYVTRQDGFDCGIMITASHNPYTDNGIKIINRHGEKFDDATTELIESYIDGDLASLGVTGEDLPFAVGERIGRVEDYSSGRNRYIAYLIALASHSFKNLRIGIDSANGSSWTIANAVFGALGATVELIGAEPDGLNINRNCGSTSPDALAALVKEKNLDIGFAFDGDADRCIAINERGEIVDGDAIMYILANRLKSRGMLNGDTVVATVMSNSGFVASLNRLGMKCIQTKVGDRFVYETIKNGDYALGGEQSGHIIIKKYATTGDGILTALMLCEELCDRKLPISKLTDGLFIYPQYIKNVRVSSKDDTLSDGAVKAALSEVEKKIAGEGRVLLRASGTEPVVRVMVEAKTEELCKAYAEKICEAIKAGGYAVG